MEGEGQTFGGEWTQEKLRRVEKYLKAYTTALKKQRFRKLYIDAFAGTGYYSPRGRGRIQDDLWPELAEEEAEGFRRGSARIALTVSPPFDEYILIEKDLQHYEKLRLLQGEFPRRSISLVNEDCNEYIRHICERWTWDRTRGVIFLDPFGMQVQWATVQAVAATEALDVWMLLPLSAINRMLPRDGNIPDEWRRKLNEVFGTEEWLKEFYVEDAQGDFFGPPRLKKAVGFDEIARYYNDRLKQTFPAVASHPLRLENSKGIPLYLLCFACSNRRPKAYKLALKIAQDILSR